jgi:hypothetical protein
MKRCVLLVAFVVALAGLSRQAAAGIVDTSSASKVYVGVKAGLVLSTFWGPGRVNEGSLYQSVVNTLLAGVTAGVDVPIILRDHFTLEPEVLFTTRGCQWNDDSVGVVDVKKTYYLRVNYIDVPVLAKLVLLKPQARFRPMLYAGAQLGFRVESHVKGKGYDPHKINGSIQEHSVADSTNFFDLEGLVGLGLQIRAGRGFFIVDVRGNLGLLEVGKYSAYRNWYGTGSVAYCFNPKRKKSLW